jgi:superfamily II DNA or RNA helicase
MTGAGISSENAFREYGNGDPPSPKDLLAELEHLRRENANLRRRLGLVEEEIPKQSDSPVQLALAPNYSTLPCVTNRSSIQDKIALFQTLFKGRNDVYALRWVNEQNGKKGYSPASSGSFGKGKPKHYQPLTDQVLYDHLSGIKTVGVYALLLDHTCFFLACDFDGDGWTLDASAYFQACLKFQVTAYLERSRSGNGGHVWIFFSEAVTAVSARQLGMRLLRVTMDLRGEMDLGSYDRFFPNQDFVPKGGFGNLIALPLQKKPRFLGNTEFLDMEKSEWIPFPDQWAFLSGVKRLSRMQLEALLDIVPPVQIGSESLGPVPETIRKKNPAPSVIRCVLDVTVNLEKSGIPSWMLSRIKHLASFSNPKFYEKQKLRLSVFQTPRVIKCYEEDVFQIRLPRGLFEGIRGFCEQSGTSLEVLNKRLSQAPVDFEFSGELTAIQTQAIRQVLKHDMGILVAPPGAGKTVMGCFAVVARKVPTLILAHRKPLLEQWRSQLMRLLGLKSKQIGQVGGGRNRQTGMVDLAMLQSLGSIKNLEEFFAGYGFVIVDECHHLPAFSFESCIKKSNARFVLGLTATPYRWDGLQDIIFMHCGPVRHQIKTANDELERTLLVRETLFELKDSETLPVQSIFQEMIRDTSRNEQIVEDVLLALGEGRRCLIFTQRREHAELLSKMFLEKGKASVVLTGSLGKKERSAFLASLQSLASDQDFLLIATGQYLGEGFDCPQMDTLFLAFPVSFKGKLVQYVGRILRTHPGKNSARIYDYRDVQIPVLQKMFSRREKTYRSIEFQIQEEENKSEEILLG